MKKRFLAVLLTLCMVFSLMPAAYAASDDVFTDVGAEEWFYDEVQYVYEKGLMQGTGDTTFSPRLTTTRGMIVTILYRLEGEPAVTGNCPFNDVTAGEYYENAIIWAAANSIVGGYGDGKFGPKDPITREQMAAILYRYADYKGYDVTAAADLSKFADMNKISSYALTAMQWANASELVDGMGDGTLNPGGSAERCQVAAILYRFCENIVNKAGDFTVTFMLNDSSSDTYKTVRVADGKTVAQPADPSRSGYTFSGWYTAASGGSKFDFKSVITADVTLYAHWTVVSSGGGGGNPTTTSDKEAATAADFIAAAQIGATRVTATILEENSITVNDDVVITNNSATNLTLNMGSASVGDLTINSTSARTITINAESAGSVSSLTINAPNATVTNHVTVNGPVTIQAVSHSTFNNDAPTGIITISGSGAVNDSMGAPVVIDTDAPVTVRGNTTQISVVSDDADLTVNTEAGTNVQSTGAGVNVNVGTNNPVTISGTVDNVQANTDTPNLTVNGTVGNIDATGATGLTVSGSGAVSNMNTGSANVEINDDASLNVDTVNATGGTINAPANTVNNVAATGNVTLNASVNTVSAGAGTSLTLGEDASVNTVEAEGDLTLDGTGSVNSVDVQNNAAVIDVAGGSAVSVSNVTTTAATTGGITVTGITGGVTVQTKAAKPVGVSFKEPTTAGGTGKITGVDGTMQHKPVGATDWTDVATEATEVTLAAGTYQVRVKATADALASEAVAVTIPAAVGVTSAAIQGTAYVGQTLTAVANVGATGTLSYQWKAGGEDIVGATRKTFTLTDAQIGKTITVRIYNYGGGTTTGDKQNEATGTLAGTVTVDKTALTNAIAKAAEVQQGVTVKTGTPTAADVALGVIFVTTAEKTALETAVTAASGANVTDATSTEVATQETALRAAIDTYVKAKKVGTLNQVANLKTELSTLIDSATAAKVDTKTSAEIVTPGTAWVLEADNTTFVAAISAAEGVKTSTDTAVLSNAITALNNSITTYLKAIRKGAALDNSALVAAINAADINAASVVISTNGADVLPSQTWVTTDNKSTYADAIAAAKDKAAGTGVTMQSNIIDALDTLNGATTTFNGQKAAGTKDIVAPVVTNVSATRGEGKVYTIAFTTNEAGSYAYQVNGTESIFINGGSFNTAGAQSFTYTWNTTDKTKLYVQVSDASGNATVFMVEVGETPAAPIDAVASVGTTKYVTLTDAIANAAGKTVKLEKDVVLTAPIDIAKTVTLDLNGKKITPATDMAGDYLLSVKYGGNLTINDSSVEKTGAIDANSDTSVYAAVKMTLTGETYVDKDAVLVVNGGLLKGYYYGVTGNGTRHHTDITINGGELCGYAAGDNLGMYHPQSGKLTINGGSITGITGLAMKSGELTITGGTIEGTGAKKDYVHNGSGFNSTGDGLVVEACDYPGGLPVVVNISGGTFISANGQAVAYYQQSDAYKLANEKFITGGTFSDMSWVSYVADNASVKLGASSNTGDANFAIDGNKSVTLDLNGQTITTTADPFLEIKAGSSLTINDSAAGGKLHEKRDYSYLLMNRGTLIINGGTFTAESIENYWESKESYNAPFALALGSGSTTTVNGGEFNGFVYSNGSNDNITVTIKDGVFNGMLYLAAKTTAVTFNGGTFNSGTELKGSLINVTGGTFNAANVVPEHNPNGNGSSTNGGWAFVVVDNTAYGAATATISNGTFNGAVALLDDDSDAGNNNDTLTITGGTFSDMSGLLYTANGGTYTLSQDASGGGISVPSGSNFTLDFGGNTYTVINPVGSTGTVRNGFQLLKDSTLTFKNGTINGDLDSIRTVIQNYSDLTLEDMTIVKSTKYTDVAGKTTRGVCVDNGTVSITGNTSINVSAEGGVALEVCLSSYTTPRNVTINTTGTFTGLIQATRDDGVSGNVGSLTINGGTFGAIVKDADVGDDTTITVTGGTFSADPSTYVANEYTATENSGSWTVVAK